VGQPLTKIRLQYIHEFVDRHGKLRRYVRLPNGKRFPLPGAPGTAEFRVAYEAALAGEPLRVEIGADRTIPGTVNAAVISYFNSSAFTALAPESRRTRRGILERFRADHGDKRISLLQKTHIDRMIASKASTPAAARNFLAAVNVLMEHCVEQGWRADNPARGVRKPTVKSAGFHSWDESDIEAFRAEHLIGTRARLALELALGTALRRSDLVTLGQQHIRDGVIQIRTRKTNVSLALPVHPALATALSAPPRAQLTFLAAANGRPLTPSSFTNWFRSMCRQAGLHNHSVHGLRKAALRRLAESGLSASVIQAVSGHASLREVQRYVAAADQARMARVAIDTVATTFPSARTPKLNINMKE
jgi:integrase